jgi:superfamily II DNA or RNA helicase
MVIHSFRDLEFEVGYSGRGRDILAKFVLPALQLSIAYDRVTSYFSVSSLLAVAQGIEQLYRRGGTMRLIVGLHAVPRELAAAAARDGEVLEAEIARVRRGIIEEAKSIRDELIAGRLATLAWMMCDGLLNVKVAWLPGSGGDTGGIFHSKSYVLRDRDDNILAACGSQNETVLGLGDNWERLSVFASWKESRQHALFEQAEFERLWQGGAPELQVRVLDRQFARSLLQALPMSSRERPGVHIEGDLEGVLKRASGLPAFFALAGPAALFPHQERAHIDALSRWPIRVMLADEVGLGKTFEAGSVIRHAIRNCGVARVLVLTPKAVLGQWQDELHEHFRLEFWRYDSSNRCFVSPTGEVRLHSSHRPLLADETPSLLLVSSQYARGDARRQDLFSSARVLPDMVVVDEAHAARLTTDTSGRTRANRLLRALRDSMGDRVPHLVLVTATPLQLDWHEYHALLDLLGLPPLWRSPALYRESLSLLAGTSGRSLQSASTCISLLRDAVTWYRPATSRFAPEDRPLLETLVEETSLPHAVALAHRHWDRALRLLSRAHPAGLLTVRNTRSALVSLGYRFPRRQLFGPEMAASISLQALYEGIDAYLSDAYYSIEHARYPNRRSSSGFVRSSYQQRLASTLTACRLTLERRLRKAERAMSGLDGDDDQGLDDLDLAYAEDLPDDPDSEPDTKGMVKRAGGIEHGYLRDLLDLCDKALEDGDPKIDALMGLLERTINTDKVLIFSRFTESLDACIQAYRSRFGVPHACFTGEQSWADTGNGPMPCSRKTIRGYLADGTVRVVFCSDAASEGINLQAARVLVNVDVPWNPARLEQRIGRIARLGQPADSVDIHNLWYPQSVEGKIYGRLIARRDLFELAVGEFPDIIARAIHEQCADPLSPAWSEALSRLQSLRQDEQLRAMQRVWQFGRVDGSRSEAIRRQLLCFLRDHRDAAGCSLPDLPSTCVAGEKDVVSLAHAAIVLLKPHPDPERGLSAELGFLVSGPTDLGLAVRHQGLLWLMGPEGIPDLLAALTLGRPLRLADTAIRVPDNHPDHAVIARLLAWSPDHEALRFGDTAIPTPWTAGSLTFAPVGRIWVPVASGVAEPHRSTGAVQD